MGDLLSELKWIVEALSQDCDVQISLFPSFVRVPDELALEFEEVTLKLSKELRATLLTEPQNTLLSEIDTKLERMSRPDAQSLWTDEALREAPEWADLRTVSRALVKAAGWSTAPPPPSSDIYIGPDGKGGVKRVGG